MEKADLTSLEMFYNRKKDRLMLLGRKEWDDSVPWERYMDEFSHEDILTDDYRATGSMSLLDIFDELGLSDYLKRIKQLLIEGRHHGIEFYYNTRKNIRVMYCKHLNTLGIRNRSHAIRSGGIRRHEPEEPEIDVIIDGLNLARAMAYKNAIADLPYGGCKTVVQCDKVNLDDLETIGFLGYVISRTRTFTGPDMGFQPEMADIIRDRYTKAITGGTKSSMGPTGGPTAYGEYLAIKEACEFVYGDRDISKRKVAVQGLGAVGYPLAGYLLKEGARLVVTDIDPSNVNRLQKKWGPDLVEYVEPADIYSADVDILSPSATGEIITGERISQLKCRIILGPANNQLRATSREGEIALSKKLADAGILFVVDWAHNTAGVIAGWAEWVWQENATIDRIRPKIESVCRDNLREILKRSRDTGKTPTEVAYENVEGLIYRES
ncbi:MAG TPA: Glu/Leu/Phe/Val dehydrogenase family protein, partial [Desulfobacteraceae bacterium]|nr:Glu/Leu/Phe/Val dehydrogenase family protein [Desulfobacteraceae bacterium]